MAAREATAGESNGQASGIRDVAQVVYLNPKTSRFERTDGGFLRLTIDGGASYPRVHLYRTFPFSLGDDYLSVRDTENEEIGIIRRLDEFPPDVVQLLREELARRYFQPVITRILRVKEEFGYTYWDVETSAGRRRFTVRDTQRNVMPVTPVRIVISDVDGNRFEIPDYQALDVRSRRIIEGML